MLVGVILGMSITVTGLCLGCICGRVGGVGWELGRCGWNWGRGASLGLCLGLGLDLGETRYCGLQHC